MAVGNNIFANYTSPSAPASGDQFPGVTGAYGLYNTAVGQQAQDYGNIMAGYQNLPSTPGYQNTANLAATGGYSDQDKEDIRARGISPIRSIYSSAQQNVDRNKALQGGYSPNYNATQAKMARDESQQISDATTNVNATLAQNIAQNKIGLAPTYAAQETAPLEGQKSLYGTTPALASTFGTQALQAANLQNNINQSPAIGSGYGGGYYGEGSPGVGGINTSRSYLPQGFGGVA
jgi:hypothetical protein